MKHTTLPLALALALTLFPAAPATAADPFYDNLLTEGQLASARGDFAGAARRFRIACFGLLEEPERLADCRARLALCEARLGHREEFEIAFRQVLEVERRFGAYRAADIPIEVRSAFEEQVAAWIPPELIHGVAAFEGALRKRTLDRLAGLPPSQRKVEIEQLAAAEPEEPRWPLELSRIAVAERSWLPAQEWAERTLELQPGQDEALCLRGRAAAMSARCAEALPDLAHCAAPPEEPRAVEDQLACHLSQLDLDGAESFIASLSPTLQQSRTIRKASRSVETARAEQAREAARSTARPDSAGSGTLANDGAGGGADDGEAGAAGDEVRRLRASLLAADDYETLSAVYVQAEQLAAATPDWVAAQRLAGEAAYRTSQWGRAVHFLSRAGLDDESPPALLFYLAVALFESGDRPGAAAALERAVPRLESSPLVTSYRERILGNDG